MIEVIPTIIARDFNELKEKVKKIEPYVKWAQLDIMDGEFVDNSTWNTPRELKNLETNLNLEVHLMVENPEQVIEDWIESGVKRIIFHFEATEKHKEIIEKIKGAGLEVGLAINPETSAKAIEAHIDQLNLVLVMTVNPGRGGQEFLKETLDKIKKIREKYPVMNIQVDGGINPKTAKKVIQAGANLLASGTAIFKSRNIQETIEQIKGEKYE